MSKTVKYLGYGVLVVIVLILSVDVRSLDEVRAEETNDSEFDATQYAQNFWNTQLAESLEGAVDLGDLLKQFGNDFEETAEKGQKIGISDHRYFLVRDSGTITELLDDRIEVELETSNTVYLASGFIFGNIVRNALPEIEIGEFVNMTHFNLVSIELNKLVEEQVVAKLKEEAAVGHNLDFVGAMAINVESRDLDSLRIIPLQINFTGQ